MSAQERTFADEAAEIRRLRAEYRLIFDAWGVWSGRICGTWRLGILHRPARLLLMIPERLAWRRVQKARVALETYEHEHPAHRRQAMVQAFFDRMTDDDW